LELSEHGVTMRSLDDGGEGFGGEILRAVRSVLSGQDMRDRARKAAMGKRAKARKGHVLGAGPKPRYGFRLVRDEKGKAIGYEPHETEMAVVRRVVGWLAEGRSLYFVQTALEAEGVPAPRGGNRWARTAAKRIATEDCYLPHSHDEIASLVEVGLLAEAVFADLADPAAGPFGIAWYGRTRSRYVSTRSKRRKVEQAPRSEWVAIPVSLEGSGLERAKVEAARASVADNRASARVGDRDCWVLSRGFLRCSVCSRSMSAYRRRKAGGGALYYYRCQPPSAAHACANRKSHRAEQLEYEATRLFEQYADRGVLLELYDEAVRKEEETGASGALERRAALVENRSELEAERRGYLRQNARGVLPDADLDAMLAEVDEQREGVQAELHAVEDQAAAARRIEAARESLSRAAWYNPVHAEWYEDPDALHPGEYLTLAASQEEIRRAYRRCGARFEVDGEGTLTLRLSLGLDGEALHLELSPSSMRSPGRASCSWPGSRTERRPSTMDRSWISPLHSRGNCHHDNTDIEANKELVRTYTQIVFNEHHTEHASDFLAR
jgi:hypothetical protein